MKPGFDTGQHYAELSAELLSVVLPFHTSFQLVKLNCFCILETVYQSNTTESTIHCFINFSIPMRLCVVSSFILFGYILVCRHG